MPRELSAGSLVFRVEDAKPFFLLLHYPGRRRSGKGYWDFPKGHVEGQETEEQTVRREVAEETGIHDLEFKRGFRQTIRYFFQTQEGRIFKVVIFYLAQTKTKDVKVSFEHTGYQWATFGEAMSQLKFNNAKILLNKANQFLSREPPTKISE
ncbi:MAG: hypothetical protein A2842_00545 [Candidatus Wildermuthbacteria bacterium RIFCSPHIGHO2_01_FULL_48_25]|uniref:Bis(5'-nucleosyl)-tetraphosphatase [asymmetrical] n=1 Tax=Candidatus Wildermuthbacteria bacterium RIFCSPLOWO2_01_FULL_48_16 TaxID=1802461 RepID=A0A1G2RL84_9BACT|nr:MAG: hypothetical protein A2842_00545 [Candidatus Wildermuthbacteria bacterium RIFCSPHIGHO2_01_FULL_48_25]OHA68425.1 MAG: hypothetical protein A3J57_01020 [Candidatus Wildermuthbacteria bacterium RIFCSPHIGHO2_02_FULL_49_12b]OHA73042.1 MAG: hypothetical protein A3B24_01355 [Candidatus Wildermuthbacteria bacterium RIFCSPLOWO2_01_FULL_48_16]